MKKYLLAIGLLLAALSSTPAHALLVSAGDTRFGPDSFTIDTATGLGWLDLSQTFDKSMNSIKAEFGNGGTYQGLRYATADEVRTLYSDGGAFPYSSTESFYAMNSMLNMMGFSRVLYGIGTDVFISVNGITDTGPVDEFDSYIGSEAIAKRWGNLPPTAMLGLGVNLDDMRFTSTSHNQRTGSYLVREATEPIPTPEPSTFLLLGIGLVGAAVMRKNKMWV